MATAKYTFVIFLLSIIFVLASVFIPVEINNKKRTIKCKVGFAAEIFRTGSKSS